MRVVAQALPTWFAIQGESQRFRKLRLPCLCGAHRLPFCLHMGASTEAMANKAAHPAARNTNPRGRERHVVRIGWQALWPSESCRCPVKGGSQYGHLRLAADETGFIRLVASQTTHPLISLGTYYNESLKFCFYLFRRLFEAMRLYPCPLIYERNYSVCALLE